MTQLAETSSHQTDFTRLQRQLPEGNSWVQQLRQAGIERFEAVGFPAANDEHWRHTNFAPVQRTRFELADGAVDASAAVIAPFTLGAEAPVELVFINGRFAPALSRIDQQPRGLKVMSLPEAMQRESDLVQAHLGRYADLRENPFVALNTGFLYDGAFVHVRRGAVIEKPIHVLYLTIPGATPTVSHVRNLFVVEDGALVPIVETYAGAADGVYFTNTVTEIALGADARVDHCKLQQESTSAFHIAATQAYLARAADLINHSATLGGRLTRNDVNVVLDGEHAHATLNGLVIIEGQQHCDNHTLLRHEKPNCPSHELYKHILDGRATCVFKGKIFVQKDAQKTDSKQTSKSLLLSDDASMNSQPALEIYADDVKCTHGSTTGPLDEDMLFYLRTRGVPQEAARHLLTYAFAADITRRIRIAPVRQRLEDFMAAQHHLPQDLRITDLGSHDEAAL